MTLRIFKCRDCGHRMRLRYSVCRNCHGEKDFYQKPNFLLSGTFVCAIGVLLTTASLVA